MSRALLLLLLVLPSHPASARPSKVTHHVKSVGLSVDVYSNWLATVQNGTLHATDKLTVVQVARGAGETVAATVKVIQKRMKPDTWRALSPWTVLGRPAKRFYYTKKAKDLTLKGVFVVFQVAPKKTAVLSAGSLHGVFNEGHENEVKTIADSIRPLDAKSPAKPAAPKPTPKVDPGIRKGDKALDFTLPKLSGGKATLSKVNDKVVLLAFWATWEKPSIKWMHELMADPSLTQRKQVRPLFAIVSDPRQRRTLKPFVNRKKWNSDLFLTDMQGKVRAQWAHDKRQVLVVYVIAKGKVVGVVRGAYSKKSHDALRKMVKAALR